MTNIVLRDKKKKKAATSFRNLNCWMIDNIGSTQSERIIIITTERKVMNEPLSIHIAWQQGEITQ